MEVWELIQYFKPRYKIEGLQGTVEIANPLSLCNILLILQFIKINCYMSNRY